MKTVSVTELKKNWDEIERQVQRGEIIEVLRRGKPSVRLVAAGSGKVAEWCDHLATAVETRGHSGTEAVDCNRDGRG